MLFLRKRFRVDGKSNFIITMLENVGSITPNTGTDQVYC